MTATHPNDIPDLLPPEAPQPDFPVPGEPEPEMDPAHDIRPEIGGPEIGGREIGGRDGPDPTRYGDWENGGRAIDF